MEKLSIEGGERNPLIAILLAGFFVVFFAAAAVLALDFHPTNQQYPIAVSVAGLLLLAVILWQDARAVRTKSLELGGLSAAWKAAVDESQLGAGLRFVFWVAVTVFGCWLIGQKFAIAGFIFLYLITWGKRPIVFSLLYAVAGYAFITVFYDKIMHIPFQTPFVNTLFGG